MAKLGISIKIDVTKIDKARLFHAKESGAKYLDLVTFIDTENEGQYGDHGFITQSATKEEREAKVQMPILGNSTVFWQGDNQSRSSQSQPASQNAQAPKSSQSPIEEGFDDDIPL